MEPIEEYKPWQILRLDREDFEKRTFSSPRFFFNQAAHLYQQRSPKTRLLSFGLWQPRKKTLLAQWSLFLEGSRAYSPFRASFGGIECQDNLDPAGLNFFIQGVEKYLGQEGVKSIYNRQAPQVYQSATFPTIFQAFYENHYQMKSADLNYHLEIDSRSLLQKMAANEKRHWKKCHKAGFIFREEPSLNLEQVYDFIQQARQRKSYPMSLEKKSFIQLCRNFPEFKLFTLRSPQEELAALGIVIHIHPEILYHFYPADHQDFLSFSPLVFLNASIYEYAREKGYKILDLGLASEKGHLNSGLAHFKRKIGALPSLKNTWVKKLVKLTEVS